MYEGQQKRVSETLVMDGQKRFSRFNISCGYSCGLSGAALHRLHYVTVVYQLIPG